MRLKGLQVLILCNQIKLWSELLLLKTLFVFRSRACFLQIHFSMTLLPNWHFLKISIIHTGWKHIFDGSIVIFWNLLFIMLRIKKLKISYTYNNMKNEKNVLYWLNVPNSVFYYGNKILRRKRTRTNFRFKIDA